MSTRSAEVLRALTARSSEFVAIRRDIHRYPELPFDEHRTSELVARRLQAWGYEVERGLGGTGVVGRLVRGHGHRRLGLRADMDALPIDETSGVPHASCHAGVMHACGHDGHTAMLLAAAEYLAREGRFEGTLNLIFQPAEEAGGGALRMMDDGLFDKYPCDAVFAMHNLPGLPSGRLVFREGATGASSDYASVTLTGVGGHGAMPHKATDPLVAAASIVMALQTIVSRNIDPLQMAVVTVGALNAGRANNVIPQQAQLEISVRALDRAVRERLRERVLALVQAQAESYEVKAAIDWRPGYSVLVNTAEETQLAREVGIALLGAESVELQGAALPGSEDFAFMLERVPGSYLFIGNGDRPGSCMVHHPGYDFDDHNVAIGGAYWVCLAERFLGDGNSSRQR
ncbi:M20 aminoacylase family protein [Roseateles violae]|uniref:M20 aminoacylase family protein n=1 Tax=Roseateles violae TaxID=3058042 RepID=A0ABT8E079_9BURK|nr:M20 aminoacylase family protein [Pelomonas sp. PFR6]MDN3923204.1 M20 aminoacylase family protein [Pelomonas sp. PFR6]